VGKQGTNSHQILPFPLDALFNFSALRHLGFESEGEIVPVVGWEGEGGVEGLGGGIDLLRGRWMG